MSAHVELFPIETITGKIFLIRGMKIMLDRDLAELYRVETGQLKRAVRRNIERFPEDFMFPLTKEEYDSLRCQIGILKRGEHAKYSPMAFTEQGVAMLSSVLNSKRAIQVNIVIMRAFVKLREIMSDHRQLAERITELENRLTGHDENFRVVFEAIRQMLETDARPKRKIGF